MIANLIISFYFFTATFWLLLIIYLFIIFFSCLPNFFRSLLNYLSRSACLRLSILLFYIIFFLFILFTAWLRLGANIALSFFLNSLFDSHYYFSFSFFISHFYFFLHFLLGLQILLLTPLTHLTYSYASLHRQC